MNIIKHTPGYAIYKICRLLDQSIASCDPLGLKEFFAHRFPKMSERGETKELIFFITNHIHKTGYERISTMNETSAMATTRDLAMFASVFVRWSVPIPLTIENLLEGLSRTLAFLQSFLLELELGD